MRLHRVVQHTQNQDVFLLKLIEYAMAAVVKHACDGIVLEGLHADRGVTAEQLERAVEAPDVAFGCRKAEPCFAEDQQVRQIGIGQAA